MATAFIDASTRVLLTRLHPDGSEEQIASLADLLTQFLDDGLGEVEATMAAAAACHRRRRRVSVKPPAYEPASAGMDHRLRGCRTLVPG
jgi:hypothetical protein